MNNVNTKIKLGKFETRNGQQRIYVNGTTREKIYFAKEGWTSSTTLPGFWMNSDACRTQPNTSSVTSRRQKDLEAFSDAIQFIVATYGVVSFDQLWEQI